MVDAITSSSESEDADDDANQVTDEEVYEAADEQLSMEGEPVVIGTERGTTFPIDIQGSKCNALIDTGATRSCISEAYFKTLPQQNLKGLHKVAVRSASGSSLAPVGFMTCDITLGNETFQHDFVVCKHLMRPLILGREFLYKNELKVYYSQTGECRLD